MMFTLELEDGRVLTATDEQTEIIDFALANPTRNLMMRALAGSAKTTTLRFLCKYLPMQPILSVAFNKRIADEMGRVLPAHVAARTLNSVGHGAWSRAINRRLTVNKDKSYDFLKAYLDTLSRMKKVAQMEVFADTLAAIRQAKIMGYIPKSLGKAGLVDEETFFANVEDEVDRDTVNAVITESIKAALQGVVDFDDQIYMSTLFGGVFPRFPRLMVDEVQDLSRINHAMLELLVSDWLGAVGDPWQSIYAFRGAVFKSMELLRDKFEMHEMKLTVSFRCPRAVVERAQKWVPEMQSAPNAAEGLVKGLEEWGIAHLNGGAAILCRNNAPLYKLAFKLLRAGKGVKVVGTDLGPNLVRALKKLGPESMTQTELLDAIDKWETAQLAKEKAPETVSDKAECFRVFAGYGATLGEAAIYANNIFKADGPIQLLSGHKSKGLEWDVVFILDPWRSPSKWAVTDEEKAQENNLEYVMTTRSKRELFLVNAEDFG